MVPFRHTPTFFRRLTVSLFLVCMGCSAHTPASPHSMHAPAGPPLQLIVPSTQQRIPVQQVLVLDTYSRAAGTTAHDVVQARRPEFLRIRPGLTTGTTPIGVYLDGMFTGGIESLSQVQASQLDAIYRISPENAAVHLGRRHAAGALYLKLRR